MGRHCEFARRENRHSRGRDSTAASRGQLYLALRPRGLAPSAELNVGLMLLIVSSFAGSDRLSRCEAAWPSVPSYQPQHAERVTTRRLLVR
jgi:hypothetical protein